jgi:hypothetical protein
MGALSPAAQSGSNDVGCSSALLEKREGAHPQLFGQMLKDKPAFYFPEKVAQPPETGESQKLESTQIQFVQRDGAA